MVESGQGMKDIKRVTFSDGEIPGTEGTDMAVRLPGRKEALRALCETGHLQRSLRLALDPTARAPSSEDRGTMADG